MLLQYKGPGPGEAALHEPRQPDADAAREAGRARAKLRLDPRPAPPGRGYTPFFGKHKWSHQIVGFFVYIAP